ncbi:MAG: SPOR domain-containing protein [Paludibacteraceae bacterium]|nr:SPOR domain-containing protein [Paludibacteraceae bacterium]
MKGLKFYSLFVILLASIGVQAEEEAQRRNLFDEMPNVEIIQDPAVTHLLQTAIEGGHQELVEIEGYRVQVYSSNQQQTAKTEALKLETILKDKVEHSVYVLYLPPFWKVRVGDFRTIAEAREYKKDFVQQFPKLMGDTYIVRDKVKVLE